MCAHVLSLVSKIWMKWVNIDPLVKLCTSAAQVAARRWETEEVHGPHGTCTSAGQFRTQCAHSIEH